MSDSSTANSQTLRAVAGDAALAAVDAACAELRDVARRVLVERVASGYLDATAAECDWLARKVALEARTAVKRAVFVAYTAARDYGTDAAAHDAPTQRLTKPYGKP